MLMLSGSNKNSLINNNVLYCNRCRVVKEIDTCTPVLDLVSILSYICYHVAIAYNSFHRWCPTVCVVLYLVLLRWLP